MSSSNWRTAAQTLSSVCRFWRHIAFSTPQIWSVVNVDHSESSDKLEIILKRGKSFPIHVFIPSASSHQQLEVLSAATDRIICMVISDCSNFLQNQFLILERLELKIDLATYTNAEDCQRLLSGVSRFSQLRELCLIGVSMEALREISVPQTGFAVLQKLEILCGYPSHWVSIVQGFSNSLMSLVLHVTYQPSYPRYQLSFPQLRHLEIIKDSRQTHLELDLKAPRLESVANGLGVGSGDNIRLQLRNPRSVKQLHTSCYPFYLTPYPALRKLWINDNTHYNGPMLSSFRYYIASVQSSRPSFTVTSHNVGIESRDLYRRSQKLWIWSGKLEGPSPLKSLFQPNWTFQELCRDV